MQSGPREVGAVEVERGAEVEVRAVEVEAAEEVTGCEGVGVGREAEVRPAAERTSGVGFESRWTADSG